MENISFLETFFDSADEESNEDEPKPKKSRRSNRTWLKDAVFQSAEEAEKSVDSKIWKKSSSKYCTEGHRVEYRCSGGRYRYAECPAGIYLLYNSTSTQVTLYKTDCDHDNHSDNPSRGLPYEMKQFIKEKFAEGCRKPNSILAAIRKNNMMEPPKAKLLSYLRLLREEFSGRPTVSAREIRQWCEAKRKIPSDDDEPFVLNFEVNAEPSNPDEQDLKIVVSSKRLLSMAHFSDMVQADATNKLVWLGYPVLIVGSSDKNGIFHPFAIAVCKGESADDFAFIFNAVRNFNSEWQPTLLLADASEAITKGFEHSFGVPEKRLTCFFHVLKNVEKYLKPLTKGGVCVNLKDDIHALQAAQDEDTFCKASELFMEKWSTSPDQRINDFIHCFHSEWLLKNSCWYEGAAIGYPSTNSGIEATNSIIKSEHTLREGLPVDQFLNAVIDQVTKWSTIRNPDSANFLNFATTPSISMQLWTIAYEWALANKKILQEPHESHTIFYVTSSTESSELSVELLTKFKTYQNNWNSFDNFKNVNYSIWIVTIIFDNLSDSTCTCPIFLKQYICEHVLGIQIKLKLVSIPPEVKSASQGQKKKRGHPSGVKRALLI